MLAVGVKLMKNKLDNTTNYTFPTLSKFTLRVRILPISFHHYPDKVGPQNCIPGLTWAFTLANHVCSGHNHQNPRKYHVASLSPPVTTEEKQKQDCTDIGHKHKAHIRKEQRTMWSLVSKRGNEAPLEISPGLSCSTLKKVVNGLLVSTALKPPEIHMACPSRAEITTNT